MKKKYQPGGKLPDVRPETVRRVTERDSTRALPATGIPMRPPRRTTKKDILRRADAAEDTQIYRKNGGKAQSGAALKNLPAGLDQKHPMKSGGKIKKGGMAAFEKTSFDKKADVPGGRHGKEGSAKDKKMDKVDAKKMGFIKGKK